MALLEKKTWPVYNYFLFFDQFTKTIHIKNESGYEKRSVYVPMIMKG